MRKGGTPVAEAAKTTSTVKPMKAMVSNTEMRMKATDQKSNAGSAGGMARSNRSVEPIMTRSMRANDQPLNLHFEDPAAVLNISDDKWNDIVKENL